MLLYLQRRMPLNKGNPPVTDVSLHFYFYKEDFPNVL